MAPIPYIKMALLEKPDIRPSTRPMIHGGCQSELNKLYPHSGQQVVLKVKLQKRMDFFSAHPSDFFKDNPLFKYFQSCDDHGKPRPIYEMRFNREHTLGNLRILFVVEDGAIYLLHAFIEKGTKSYSLAYEVVKGRLSS